LELHLCRGQIDFACEVIWHYGIFCLQFDAEFRRFGLNRSNLPTFDEFIHLIEEIHMLSGSSFTVSYTDPEGDLLPVSNNENYAKALTTAQPLLRVFVHRKGDNKAALMFVTIFHSVSL